VAFFSVLACFNSHQHQFNGIQPAAQVQAGQALPETNEDTVESGFQVVY
jgi:hypothetical protein